MNDRSIDLSIFLISDECLLRQLHASAGAVKIGLHALFAELVGHSQTTTIACFLHLEAVIAQKKVLVAAACTHGKEKAILQMFIENANILVDDYMLTFGTLIFQKSCSISNGEVFAGGFVPSTSQTTMMSMQRSS
jgi:hypothetical protein